MTIADVWLLIRKITIGVMLTLIPLLLIAGGIRLIWQLFNSIH
jgi:hypothetical protein